MAKSDIRLTPEIREVLEQATYNAQGMTLPETAIYAKVKKFLEAIGAYWVKRTKTHIWDGAIESRYKKLLEEGGFVDKKVLHQQFFTPVALTERIVNESLNGRQQQLEYYPETPLRIMDPSCGDGRFLDAVVQWLTGGQTAKQVRPNWVVVGVELDQDLLPGLRAKGHKFFHIDFLKLEPKWCSLCDYIYMNPPFTNGQDMKHVMHAFRFLKPGGTLTAIVASNAGTGENKLHEKFADFMDLYCIDTELLDSGEFKESGTMVRTKILTFFHPDY